MTAAACEAMHWPEAFVLVALLASIAIVTWGTLR